MSKTWLITGVSSGFGYEMTKQLLEIGDTVIGTVRNRKNIEEFIAKYPETFDCRILDVTDVPAVHTVVDEAFAKHKIRPLSNLGANRLEFIINAIL